MSEFIGSRISLISKSDIRYVGTLKAIDSDSATVSLERVQCMGSEGRKEDPSQEVAANDLIYDGIVFRGSDVKDLSILAAPGQGQQLNDPAIVQQQQQQPPQQQQQQRHQSPPQPHHPQQFNGGQFPPQYQQPPPPYGYPGPPMHNQFQQQPRFAQGSGAHGFPGTAGAVQGYGGPPQNFGGMDPRFGPPPGHGFPQGPYPPQMHMGPGGGPGHQRPPQNSGPHQGPIGSKDTTPQPAPAQAPQPPAQKPVEMSTTPATVGGTAPPPAASNAAIPGQPPNSIAQKPAQAKTNSRVAVPLPAKQQARAPVPAQSQAKAPVQPTQATSTEAATAAVAAAMAKLANLNQPASGVDNLTQKVDQLRVQDGAARGRGRGRGAPRGGARRDGPQKTVELPKEDFDFEVANAKFNKQELAKEAIATGSPVPEGQNGATEASESATNGAAQEDVVIPAKPVVAEKGYDKKSSFFDNISSDLKDRIEQKQSNEQFDGRTMRREERSKNVETFGQGSVDGGFRGRGRGRGRGFSRGGRGYHGGRGGAGFENRGGFRGGRGGRGEAELA